MDPFSRYLTALETTMRRATAPKPESPSLLYGMLHYHLGWVDTEFNPVHSNAGKRLRPVFLLLVCEAQGGDWRQALPAAAAVELLHNFSLIHDDIEDQDPLRRGRATLWSLWGEAQAINAGDTLFSLAYRALHQLQETHLAPHQILRIHTRFTETTVQLTEGQCMDIAFEKDNDVDEATYLRMVKGKTAALAGLACEVGGLIADAPAERVAALRDFGYHVGMSFQMQDDLLGLWGDPARTGKPVGSDLRQHKKTLPILHGLAHSSTLRTLLQKPQLDEEDIGKAQEILETVGSRAYTERRARAYHQKALEALERSQGVGEAQQALYDLTQRLLNRDQ
ncbi:MAG: polyprenyl synthetase family protein [Anaerolineae bacterium]